MEPVPDPRTEREGICGAISRTGGGMEWVCIRRPHNPGYVRKTGDRTHRAGEVVYGTGGRLDTPLIAGRVPTADQHHFVRRYPNRP